MKKTIKLVLYFCVFISLCNCTPIRVITATYHEPQIQTPESIIKFAHKHRIDGYPLLRYDTSFDDFGIIMLKTPIFNREGKYISFGDNRMNCSDDKFQYKAMKFLLENGDSLFITDSITQNYNIVSDSITQQKILEQIKSGKPVLLDSSQLNNINKKKSMHLNNYAPYLRTLSGDKIDIKTLYKEYIILVEFIMSGRPNLTAIKIRRVMKDVEKLNKQFNNRMQIVLINGDLINNNMQANM